MMVSLRRLAFALIVLALPQGAGAAFLNYSAVLNGSNESPSNGSSGTGFAQVDLDTLAHTMRVRVTFSNLLGTVTASHIHAATATAFTGTAGVATTTPTFTGFPSGVTSGSFDATFDMTLASSYNASYITANGGTTGSAESALFAAIGAGKSYLNIHSSSFAGGEIRGFLVGPVPEPSSALLCGIAGLSAWAAGRARRRLRGRSA